ncbi:MAG: hypothetical protein RIT19_207, partial [Verrucomicrobiota bacterium]
WATGGPIDLVVHWVGGAGSLNIRSHEDCPTRIRGIQSYEMANGYSDIAYNLLICPHGTIYEGRGLGVQGAANGPQTNATKPSVCLLLNQADTMTPAMQDRILDLNRAEIPGRILGHREVNSTTCPGDQVFAWILSTRIVPPPTPQPPILVEDELVQLVKCDNGDPMVLITNSINARWVRDEKELRNLKAVFGDVATWAPENFYRPVLVGPAPSAGFAGRPADWPVR